MFIYCANIHFGTLKGISRCNMILLDCIKMGGMSFKFRRQATGLIVFVSYHRVLLMFFAAVKIATFPHSGIFICNVRLSVCNIIGKS